MKFLITFFMITPLLFFLAACAYSIQGLSEFKEARSYLETTQTFNEAYVHSFFTEWMVQFEKNYSTNDEMTKRREIFKKNLLHIQKFNTKGNNTYHLGINQFTDENEEDKSECVVGTDELLAIEERVSSFSTSHELLSFFDWRDHGAVTPVRQQGKCGSCWAFAATSAIESLVYISGGDLRHLSAQELIDCDIRDHGCKGGRPEKAFIYASRGSRGHGITDDSLYPYQGTRQPCHVPSGNNKIAVYIDGYTVLSSVEGLVRIAVTQQPVVAILNIGVPFKQYKGGIFKGPFCGNTGRHAVLMVGFGETHDGVKYWILKNSWGEDWGEEGYIRLLRGDDSTFGLCNILSRPIYPMHVV